MKLPLPSLMDSVGTAVPVQRLGILGRLACGNARHAEHTKFTWIDYRAGPGSFADTWHGYVCVKCGTIIERFERTASTDGWPLAQGGKP